MADKLKKDLNVPSQRLGITESQLREAQELGFNHTPLAPSRWFQSFGFDELRSTTGQVANAAIDVGWNETGIDSIKRMREISRAEELTNYTDDELKRLYNRKYNSPRGGVGQGWKNRPTLEEFNLKERPSILQPDDANTKYGISGHLSWDKPVSSLVAKIQHERKLRELRLGSTLDRAQGFVDNSLGFGLAMGTAIFDPVGLAIGFVPILGEARYAKLGVTAARLARGAEAGFVGSLAVEPLIYAAKTQEKADYDMMDSLTNITFGTVAGAGLFAVGGKFYDGYKGLRSKSHAAALETAIKQAANGHSVEVGSIATHGASHKVYAANFDAMAPDEASINPFEAIKKAGETSTEAGTPLQGVETKFEEDPASKARSPIKEFKPYEDVTTSMTLMDQATAPRAAKVTTAQITRALADPQFDEAVQLAKLNGMQNNIAFYVRTVDNQILAVKTDPRAPMGLLTSKSFSTQGTIDMAKVSADLKDLLAIHGIKISEEEALDIAYKGSYNLAKNNMTHVMEIKNAVFDPKQNQHNVVLGPEMAMESMFAQDAVGEVFNDLNPKGKAAVESAMFDPDTYLDTTGDMYNSFAGYDTAFDINNLESSGKQLGTNKGGLFIDKNDNSQYYVKFYAKDQALNEWVAATLYTWYGVPMPKTTLVTENRAVVGVASDWIKNFKTLSPSEFKNLPEEQQRAFAQHLVIDAYLANWDVVGNAPNFNMQMIEGKGAVWRIDPGGALLYRAQGELKGDKFTSKMMDYKSIMDKNPDVFGKVSLKDTEEAVARILRIPQDEVNKLVDSAVLQGMDKKLAEELKEKLALRRLDLEKTYSDVAKEVAKETNTVKFFNTNDANKFLNKFYDQIEKSLTSSEMNILKSYTNSGYVEINNALWGKEVLGKTITPEMQKKIDLLDSVFKKLPETKEKYEVWRGNVRYTTFNNILADLNLKQFVWDQNLDGLKAYELLKAAEGHIITMHGYSSTSFSYETAKNFHGSFKGKAPLTKILVPEGSKAVLAGSVSSHKSEVELLLDRGAKFRVKQVIKPTHDFGDPTLVLEVLPDPNAVMPFEVSDAQKLKLAKAYHKQPSNAADAEPLLNEPKDSVADAMKAIGNDLKLIDDDLLAIQANIEAEMANLDPELGTALKAALDTELKALDQKQANAVDMHKAAEAAVVCIKKGM